MTQIPILSGIYTDTAPEYRTSYPVNMVPIPKATGIANGYLRPADGIVPIGGTLPGIERGGIEWRGQLYRVCGSQLCRINADGSFTALGDVGPGGRVTFDYSFDRLAIASGGALFYWDSTLQQVTDPDLGNVVDMLWVDGFFMTTDGEFLVVTDLNDPFAVNPLKYGSSEADPDPVVALLKVRNEVYAINRHTIEVFDNIGGNLFPFARIEGAQIQKGAVGTFACAVYLDTVAFLGSGRNEAPAIYLGANGVPRKLSTQEVDTILLQYTETQLAAVQLEVRNDRLQQELWIRLPDRTLVYDAAASAAIGEPVWHNLVTTVDGFAQHRASGLVWCYDRWNVGDPQAPRIGYMVKDVSTHWGDDVRWEFGTAIVYNSSLGAIVHRLELVALTGWVASGTDPVISTSYTLDGITWSQDATVRAGAIGQRAQRLVWLRQGAMRQWRAQRFRGTSAAHIAPTRLEVQFEGLAF